MFYGDFAIFRYVLPDFSDASSRISLKSFFENMQSLLHLLYLQYISYACMVLTLSWSLIE